jgi:ribosome-binding protein aMBF1 (putative translation factor)
MPIRAAGPFGRPESGLQRADWSRKERILEPGIKLRTTPLSPGDQRMAATRSDSSDLNDQLVRKLVNARKKAGLSQRQLADQLGKKQSYVAKYETTKRRLDIGEYVQVAQELGLVVEIGAPGEPP